MVAADDKRREERVKLAAAALSNLGVATAVTGLVAPLVSGHPSVPAAILSFTIGGALHLCGQLVLHFVAGAEPREAT